MSKYPHIDEGKLEIELCQLERGKLIERVLELEEEIAHKRFQENVELMNQRNK